MSAPAPWKIRSISSMFSSNKPSVDGFVSISPAVCSSTFVAQVVDVDVAARVRADRRQLVAGHRHARGVRPVRRVGDDDVRALLVLAAVGEVRVEEHQPGQLALAAGRGLQRHRVEPGHLEQDLLQLPLELERALRGVVLDERMQLREPRQPDEPLVDPRVVLHRAAAERIEAGVDPEVARRELREVPQHLRLRELGQARRLLPPAARPAPRARRAPSGGCGTPMPRRPACDFS